MMNSLRLLIEKSFIYRLIVAICTWSSKAFFFTVSIYKGHGERREIIKTSGVYKVLTGISEWLEKHVYQHIRKAFLTQLL